MAASRVTILLVVLATALLAGRFLLLDADVPPWFAPHDLGLHLDDGYKTLSARNLVEFGQTHWNPHDAYTGWSRHSPLTQALYELSFRIGGVEVSSPRFVVVSFFVGLVVAFVLTFRRDLPGWAVAAGVLLLALDPMLYHFSRVALFEVPLTFFACLGLFALYRVRDRHVFVQLLVLVLAAALATRLVKPSGLLYLAPALVALPAAALIERGFDRKRALAVLGCLAAIALLLHQTQNAWRSRFYVEDPAWIPQRLLNSGLQELTPIVMAAALLCVLHGLATRPAAYLRDRYRLALVSLLVGVPLLLTLFETPPPRHYVAMVAAAPLLIADHLGRGLWRWQNEGRLPVWARLTIGLLSVLLAWYVLRAIDFALLRNLPLEIGETRGILAISMYQRFGPIALVSFALSAAFAGWYGRPRLFRPAIATLLVAFVGFGVAEQVRTLASPTYDAEAIRERLRAVTAPGASIGGDWAPILTLGTGRKTLYVNEWCNPAPTFRELRPDYFLSARSWQDDLNFEILQSLDDPTLGPPIPLGRMLGNDVVLHPLVYRTTTSASDR